MWIASVPRLDQWLSDYPHRDESNAPLRCKLQSGEKISYHIFRKIPREATERANLVW